MKERQGAAVDDLGYGRIIWLDVTDPQGNPAGEHAAVILTTTAERNSGQPIKAVVISSKFHGLPKDDIVEVPWQRGGHIHTGLSKPSAAICSWKIKVEDVAHIRKRKGKIPDKWLLQIAEKAKKSTRN